MLREARVLGRENETRCTLSVASGYSIASHSALGSALCPLLRRGSGERDEWPGQFWIAVLYRGWRSEKTGIQTKLSVTR